MAAWCCVLNSFVLVLACLPLLLYLFILHLKNKWSRKGIPLVDANPVLGNMTDIVLGRKSMSDVIKNFYLKQKKKPFVTFFAFTQPMVMVNDLEVIKAILVKDFGSFPDHNFGSSPNDPMNYHNILAQRGQKWKSLRTKLSPTFSSGKIKKMFKLIDACGQDLVAYINKHKESNDVLEVKEALAKFTTDSVATVAFGIEGNAFKNPDSEFRRILRLSTELSFFESVKATLAFMYPELVEKLDLTLSKPEVGNFCRKVVWESVEYRQKNNVKRNDFLDLLLELKHKGKIEKDDNLEPDEGVEENNEKIDLEGDKFVAQCFIFMVAGHETSATTMTNALFELATQPQIQQRAYEEISSTLAKHGEELTYDAVHDMSYIHMILLETLRKYPFLPFLDRRAAKPYRIPGTGIDLEVGQAIMIPVMGIHWDPDIYPDPQRFEPERFNEENKKRRPPCTFLGFGEGPRICLGMRLGWMQVKIGLIYILRNYKVFPTAETPTTIRFQESSPFSQAKGDMLLRFEKRDSE